MKVLINSASDLRYLARSPEELPRLRKFGARVSEAFEVGSFINLFCQCNPALDPTKLHVKVVAPLTVEKTNIVGAEPEMAVLIREREGRFYFLMTEVILRDFGGGSTRLLSSTLMSTSCSSGARVCLGKRPEVSPIAPGKNTLSKDVGPGRVSMGPVGPGGSSTIPSVISHFSSGQQPR